MTTSNKAAFSARWAAGVAAALMALAAPVAKAQTIIDSWGSVATPPPPALQPVTVDTASTALLMLDFNATTCNATRRPSCVRSIAPVSRLLSDARARHMLVVYSTSGVQPSTTPDVLAPRPDEPSVTAGVDKFVGTDLEKILAAHSVKSVIVVGTSAHGAVLYTASGAALRKLAVIVPVDGFSSDTPFAELITAWLLKNAPDSVSTHVTLTRANMITMH